MRTISYNCTLFLLLHSLFPSLGSQDGLTALDVASGSDEGDSARVYEMLSKHMQELATATHQDSVSVMSEFLKFCVIITVYLFYYPSGQDNH